jgi:hypothetical protein
MCVSRSSTVFNKLAIFSLRDVFVSFCSVPKRVGAFVMISAADRHLLEMDCFDRDDLTDSCSQTFDISTLRASEVSINSWSLSFDTLAMYRVTDVIWGSSSVYTGNLALEISRGVAGVFTPLAVSEDARQQAQGVEGSSQGCGCILHIHFLGKKFTCGSSTNVVRISTLSILEVLDIVGWWVGFCNLFLRHFG